MVIIVSMFAKTTTAFKIQDSFPAFSVDDENDFSLACGRGGAKIINHCSLSTNDAVVWNAPVRHAARKADVILNF